MFLLPYIALLLTITYILYQFKKFKSKIGYFDRKGIVNIKPKFGNQIILQNKSMTEIIMDLSKVFEGFK